jgi:mannose-6-phosphate isomerase-like protein (cupin superfamily)
VSHPGIVRGAGAPGTPGGASYPEPRYTGEGGETSATYRPASQPADLTYPTTGNTVHYLATGASTNGLFGLYRWVMGPEPSGPEAHFHRSIAESFYVLSGSIRIYDGRQWIDTTPGDFVHVPEGGIHGFRNESGAPASMLIHFAPGAPREPYFEGIINVGQMSADERAEFMLRHDTFWLPQAQSRSHS